MSHRWNEDTVSAKWTKTQRIQWLGNYGLNVPMYTSIGGTASARQWAENHKTASIRCEPNKTGTIPDEDIATLMTTFAERDESDNWKMPPHFPYIQGTLNIADILQALVIWGWHPIVTDGISFEMNQFAGAIKSIKSRNPNVYDFLLEAVLPTVNKPANVRAVTHGGKINIRLKLPQSIADLGNCGALSEIYSQIKVFRKQRVYLEFSYLDRPMGWKKSRVIFWEGHMLSEAQL